MKKFLVLMFSAFMPLMSSANMFDITWLLEDNVYVTTMPGVVAYEFPNKPHYSAKYAAEYNKTQIRECISYDDYKQKKIKKASVFKVRGYANSARQLYYDTYVIEIKEVLYYLPVESVSDNSVLDRVNQELTAKHSSLIAAVEECEERYESEKLSTILAYTDSLDYYKNLKRTLPSKISSIEDKIKADFKAIEDEEHDSWYNSLPVSTRKVYDNILALSEARLHSPNSAGGCDYTIYYKNKSHKTIKYLYWTGDFYNDVEDRVYCEIRGSSSFTGKDTGPVATGEWNGGTWDCVIYNWSASNVKLTNISVTYMDGSHASIGASDIKRLLSEPDFTLFGSQKAIQKFGGNESWVISQAVKPYKDKLKTVDDEIKKWTKRLSDANAEDFVVYYKERDEKHKSKFRYMSSLKDQIKKAKEELSSFRFRNFL